MSNRVDFTVVFSVQPGANPNGDPLEGNRPRQLANGHGEVSDVCIKRKIRNRLDNLGENILIKSKDKCDKNEAATVEERYEKAVNDGKTISQLTPDMIKKGLEEFIDIRMFGQVYSFTKSNGENTTGAVSIESATSVDEIEIRETQITKSISNKANDKDKKGSDTMGTKTALDNFALYKFHGTVVGDQAERNGLTEQDINQLKTALMSLFLNDTSTARPFGSLNIERIVWFEHNSKTGDCHPALTRSALKISKKPDVETPESVDDYIFELQEVSNIKCEDIVQPWV